MVLKANKRCPYCGKEIYGFNENACAGTDKCRNRGSGAVSSLEKL